MTQRTAIILVYTAMVVVMAAAFLILEALRAPNTAIVFVYFIVLGVGADTCAKVVMRYSDKSDSKHRR